MIGPNNLSTPLMTLNTGTQYTRKLEKGNNTHYMRWFNWGYRDFRINVDVSQGNVTAYMNFFAENTFINNGYLAIPFNVNNSRWSV
jgi:hypothetical protein